MTRSRDRSHGWGLRWLHDERRAGTGPRARPGSVSSMHPVLAEIFGWEAIVVVLVILLVFGSSRIPQLARSLGQATTAFKQGLSDGDAEPPSDPPRAT